MEESDRARRIEEALEQVRTIEDPVARAEAFIDLLPVLPETYRELALEDARRVVEDIRAPEVKAKLLMDLAPHLSVQEREKTLQQALSVAQETEDLRLIGTAQGEWAQALVQMGDLGYATELAQQALDTAESYDNRPLQLQMMSLLDSIRKQLRETQPPEEDEEGTKPPGKTIDEEPPEEPEPVRREPVDIAARALADRPSGEEQDWEKKDYLKFSDYAKALADLIEDEKLETPLTIGIDAPWGMGKTTLMYMIKSRLERSERYQEERSASEPFPTVWFNAWRHDKEESLWAALILEILAKVRPDHWRGRAGLWWTLNKERFKLLLLRSLRGLLISLGVLAVVLVAIVVLWTVGPLRDVGLGVWGYAKILGGLGVLVALYTLGKDMVIFFYRKVTNPLKLGVTRYISSKPNYEERLGFLDRFNDDFECVVSWVTNGGTKKPEEGKKKLVIFIDDLDRSAPAKTAEVIEAISMLLDAEGCVFVLGMDSQMVANSIEMKYKDVQVHLGGADSDEPALGRRFLEKIVQIPFAIPKTNPKAFDKFIRNNLEVGEQGQGILAQEVVEAERLIEKERREQGKSLDAATEAVQAVSDTTRAEAAAEAKVEIRAKSFLRDSEEVEQVVSRAAPYLEYNPRKVKRFINLFKLQVLIANRRRLLDQGTFNLDQLSKWLLISTRWPAVIEATIADQNFVERLLRAHEKHTRALLDEEDPISDPLIRRLTEDRRIARFYKNQELNGLLSELSSAEAEPSPYLSLTQITTGTS